MRLKSLPLAWFLGFFVAWLGCFGPSDAPRLAKAKGKVTMKGAPLANIGVTFFPEGSGPMAVGKTNQSGEFVMMTTKPGDGACVGKHKITLGAAEEGTSEFGSAAKSLPKRYGFPDTSGLSVEVIDGKQNEFSLEVVTP